MTDISKIVMKKIVTDEKRRIFWWQIIFYSLLLVLAAGLLFLSWQAWQTISDQRTLDLLTLFREDREIITEFWQDTLITFINELPQQTLITISFVIVVTGVIYAVTRKARRVIKKKSETISTFKTY